MMRAYTAAGSFYPPYVNVAILDDGQVRIIIRPETSDDGQLGSPPPVEIIMPRDEFESVFGPLVDEVRSQDVIDT
jgi:hypothetical protein